MNPKKRILLSFVLVYLIVGWNAVNAQGEKDYVGVWFNTEKDAKVEIFKEGNQYFGKVVWLKEPTDKGKPKVDKNNSDKSKRTKPILGMRLLNGFELSDGVLKDGTIYDPKNGKTYSCIIKKKDEKTLEVRGYIGFSLIGRTVEWTKAE